MTQQALTLTPGARPLAQSLGFTAASVICDNYTSSYLTLADAGKTIPPWTYGAVVSLPEGIRQASATLTPTVPAVAGPPVPVSQAILTWTDQALPADPGHLLQQAAYSQQTVIGTLIAAAGQSATPQVLAVPAGTMSIGYIVWSDPGHDTPLSVSIIGHQSFNEYIATGPLNNSGGPQWFPFGVSDTSVDVTLTASGAKGARVDFLASPLVEVLDIQQTFGSLLDVQLTNNGGVALALDNPAVNVFQLVATQNGATAAPWQAAKLNAPASIASVAAGGTQTLIAASTGVTLYLHGYSFSQDNANAASLWELQDSSGTLIASWFDTNVRKVFASGDFRGFPVAIGKGVRMFNGGGLASFLGGFLSYSTG